MRRIAFAFAVVTTVVALGGEARAYPCFDRTWIRCHDGAARALYTDIQKPMPQFGYKGYFERHRTKICDSDKQCDGVCTFAADTINPEVRVPVGQSARPPYGLCPINYVCKKGWPIRCRKLARRGARSGSPGQ